jgi:hypothetical protein
MAFMYISGNLEHAILVQGDNKCGANQDYGKHGSNVQQVWSAVYYPCAESTQDQAKDGADSCWNLPDKTIDVPDIIPALS